MTPLTRECIGERHYAVYLGGQEIGQTAKIYGRWIAIRDGHWIGEAATRTDAERVLEERAKR